MSRLSRPRAVFPLAWLLLVTLGLLQGCNSGPIDLDSRRFPCVQDDECVSGFVCREGMCQPEGEPVDRPDSGVPDAGKPDAGKPDAGTPDGGRPDSGVPDAGRPDSGVPDSGVPDSGVPDSGVPDSGVPDSGVPDSGVPDAGPVIRPTQLAFATAPLTVEAGKCSPGVILETRAADGRAAPVATATTVLLTTKHKDFDFYSDPLCQNMVTQVTVPSGGSRATFYFQSPTVRVNQVDAAATGLGIASQDETIRPAPPSAVVFVTLAQTVQAGACSGLVSLEARDPYGNTSSFSTATAAALSVSPAGGLTFFSDAGCTNAITSTTFASGATRANFYFRGRTGITFTVSAQVTGFTRVSQAATLLPVVRTGTCTLADTALSVSCPISPPQRDVTKTMLLYQATSSSADSQSANVRCALTSTSTVTCSRSGGLGVATVGWQTAELASGLRVQHVDTTCGGLPTVGVPIQPIASTANAFVLVSSQIDGTTHDTNDFFTAYLGATDHVDLQFGTSCISSWSGSLQVVELTGATVARGILSGGEGTQFVASGLPAADPATSVLLFTYRLAATSLPGICDRVLRGEITSSTSLTFTRAAGATGCEDAAIEAISWERISLGARGQAQHQSITLGDGAGGVQRSISAVDPTRTLVFASGQALSGQGGGEGSYASDDVLGAVIGRHFLASPTLLEVRRDAPVGSARWFSTVLQIEP
jgi:hypothetical protein